MDSWQLLASNVFWSSLAGILSSGFISVVAQAKLSSRYAEKLETVKKDLSVELFERQTKFANRLRCGPTGSWWSWINTHAGSLASASMRERSMVSHSVGCSTVPFEGNTGCRGTSAPITIRFIGSTSGKPTCGYWK